MLIMGNSAASCATQNQHYQAMSMGRATCMTLGCGSRIAEKRDQQQVGAIFKGSTSCDYVQSYR